MREARDEELAALQQIERAAGRAFADIGMSEVSDDEPFSVDELRQFRTEGQLLVAIDERGHPAGYLAAEPLDGNAHIEQVSVHPVHAGEGIGRALIDRCADWARAAGLPALTLTAFAEVPWNAPYYRRLGFQVLAEEDIGPGLRDRRSAEAADGLDRWPRVCMRRDV